MNGISHTSLTRYLFHSVGSKHIRNCPFGFSTTTKLLIHSIGYCTSLITSLSTKLSKASFNFSFIVIGILLAKQAFGTASCLSFIVAVSGNFPSPVNTSLYSFKNFSFPETLFFTFISPTYFNTTII